MEKPGRMLKCRCSVNPEAVWDIQESDGTRLRGGVRTIRVTDLASGRTVTVATVKGSVRAD